MVGLGWSLTLYISAKLSNVAAPVTAGHGAPRLNPAVDIKESENDTLGNEPDEY